MQQGHPEARAKFPQVRWFGTRLLSVTLPISLDHSTNRWERGFFGHPEVSKPHGDLVLTLIYVFTVGVTFYRSTTELLRKYTKFVLHLCLGFINLSLSFMLYAVIFICSQVLLLSCLVSDNLENLKKQQPTNWLRDFTQIDNPHDAFLNWLTGFIEGDGSFPASARGDLSFYISQSTHNIWVLVIIRAYLGFGKIRFQFSENMAHFVVEDQASLLALVQLLNGRFHTRLKWNAFSTLVAGLNLKLGLNLQILPRVTSLNYNWLAGFTDADGSFYVNFVASSKMLCGYQTVLNIAWSQKDPEILQLIQAQFKGTLAHNKTTGAYVLTIKSQEQLAILLSIFTVHTLRGRKYCDFLDACTIYSMMKAKEHLTIQGVDKIRAIKARMNQRRPVSALVVRYLKRNGLS